MKKDIGLLSAIGIAVLALLLVGCAGEDPPRARPYGFHKISLPETIAYQSFVSESCPFSFQYPVMGEVSREMKDSCWVDIYFPDYDLKWHLTHRYVPDTELKIGEHFEEHRKLIYKHSKKATQIAARDFETATSSGTAWEVYGNVGTPAYYFIADSAKENMLTVSFYFNTAMKNDSLAPVIDYMRGEMEKALQTLEWN